MYKQHHIQLHIDVSYFYRCTIGDLQRNMLTYPSEYHQSMCKSQQEFHIQETCLTDYHVKPYERPFTIHRVSRQSLLIYVWLMQKDPQ